MSVLIIFNRQPYDGTDVTWNGLRLYFEGAEKSTMAALAEWVTDSDKVLTF